jgi:hypothetical protein
MDVVVKLLQGIAYVVSCEEEGVSCTSFDRVCDFGRKSEESFMPLMPRGLAEQSSQVVLVFFDRKSREAEHGQKWVAFLEERRNQALLSGR